MTAPKRKPTTTAADRAKAAGARTPADRKPAARAEADGDRFLSTVVDGLEVTIDRELLDDYDVLEQLAVGAYFSAGPSMFGDEQWDAIKAHLRDENGRLKMTRVDEFVRDVFEAVKAGNS